MLKPELTAIAKVILEQNYRSDEPGKTLIPLKGGEWSAAYKFSLGGRSFVIRLSHTPENFYRDKTSARWSSSGLPIPRILKIDRHLDHYYAISHFFPGEALEKLPADDLERAIPAFLAMMSELQTIDLDSVPGFGSLTPEGQGAFPSWREALLDVCNDHPDSLMHGWRKILAQNPEAQYNFDRFYKQLTELVNYCPEQKHLIHSDLIYQNLLVDNHNISAVLDWGCAMLGDPVYDLAWFSFYEPWFPAFTQVDLIQKMQRSYLEQFPENHKNFYKRMIAYQIHLTLLSIAYCVFSKREKDLWDTVERLAEVVKFIPNN